MDYTAVIPDAWDARKLLCMLVKRFNINVLAIGKHSNTERLSYQQYVPLYPSVLAQIVSHSPSP